MSWHVNSNKHKAMHGGYKGKPSKKEVTNLCSIYLNCLSTAKTKKTQVKVDKNGQIEFDF